MPSNVLMFEFLAVDHFAPVAEHVGRKLDGVGEKMGRVGKTAAFAIGKVAVGGLAAFGYEMVKGVQAATDYQTLQLKTAAVIKSTGNQAHISVAGIDKLASSLESMSGVDETLIINSENVLATFTNVRNAAGKSNDIFDQGTKSALDLSVAMGEDLQSATVQVGKALNNPIKGVTALQRVGVSFSATQKEQIKHFQTTGNLMGAQKIILKELSKEFGGAAKAAGSGFGGAMARVKDSVEDAFRDMATSLLPMLTKVANWFADHLPGAIKATGHALTAIGGFLADIGRKIWSYIGGPVTTAVGAISRFVRLAVTGFKQFWSALQGNPAEGHRFGNFIDTMVSAGSRLRQGLIAVGKALVSLGGYLRGLAQTYGPSVLQFFARVGSGLQTIALRVAPVVLHFFRTLGPVIATVAKAIGGYLVTGITVVVHYFRDLLLPALRDAGVKIFPQLRKAVETIGAAFRDHMDVIRTFGQVFMFILKVVGVALAALALLLVKVVIPVIAELITIVLSAVGPIVRALLSITGALITVIKGIANFAVNAVKTVANVIGDIIGLFSNSNKWLLNAGTKIISGLIQGFLFVKAAVTATIHTIIALVTTPFLPAAKMLLTAGKNFVVGLLHGWVSMNVALANMVSTFISKQIINRFAGAVGWLLTSGKNILVGLIKGYVGMWANVARTVANFINRYILAPYARAIQWLVRSGANVLAGLVIGFRQRYDNVVKFLRGVITRIGGLFGNSVKWLFNAGFNVLYGFWQGLKAIWDKVTGWISGIATWIKNNKGPVSLDGRLLIPAGKAIMMGFLNGLKSGAGKAWSFVKSIGGKTKEMMAKALGWVPGIGWVANNVKFSNTGAGGQGFPPSVARWAGMVRAALQMEALDTSLVPKVLRQIQTESGGNPNIIQGVHDVNWPNNRAQGLMQVIPPTFRAFHWPGTSWSEFDPMANIAAGLNYARHRYGPDLSALGQGHGYDTGGLARGSGWFRKFVSAPERILSPRQTAWFERAMAQGTRGHARGLGGVTVVLNAPNYVGSRNEILDEFTRLARLGRLDHIVRMATR